MNKGYIIYVTLLLCTTLSCRKDGQNGFEPPDTHIIFPADGDTVTEAQLTCEWEGLDNAVSFRYRLDNEEWSDWSTHTTHTFLLDEGIHDLSVSSRNEFNREDPTPAHISFTVDAISGPALWIKSRQTTVEVSTPCSLFVWIEDIEHLMLGSIECSYDNALLKINAIEVDTSLLTAHGGTVQFIPEFHDTSERAVVTFGIVGGSPKGVSGSGPLFMIDCLLKSADTAQINFASATELRDTCNVAIPLVDMISGTIIPE